jgi:hypothetical protein
MESCNLLDHNLLNSSFHDGELIFGYEVKVKKKKYVVEQLFMRTLKKMIFIVLHDM